MLLVQLARPTAVGFPEGIKVTVHTWCYYVFNDRGPFYSLSTCRVKLPCKVAMPQYNGIPLGISLYLRRKALPQYNGIPLGISLYLRRKALIDQLLY